jgi:RNA polymerase sigma-70 factor (ECF subfamily)
MAVEKGLLVGFPENGKARGRSRSLRSAEQAMQPPSFSDLYEEFAQPILRYCRVRIDDPVEAEDAAALIFTNALAAWPPDDPAAVRSWLFAIAHNVIANHYRTTSARAPARPLEEALLTPDRQASPDEVVIEREERAALLDAIAELTAEQRQVIELRLAGLTGPEIAAATGRSHAAIKMLQYRAISHLRVLLALAEADPVVTKGARAKETNHGS